MPRKNVTLPLLAFVSAMFAAGIAGCSAPSGDQQRAGEEVGAGNEVGAAAPEVLIPAPDFSGIELLDQNAEPIAVDGLRGKPALLAFIYTRCPMPMMCPATMLRFQEVQKALSIEERAQVQLITVTFDPTYDTPEVLAEYADLWEVDDSFWALLTGAEEDIHRIASSYGQWYEQTEDGNFDHAMYSMILLPDGSLHEILRGSMWSSKEVAGKLVEMVATSTPAPH